MSGKLPENILIFARGLRRAGLKLGALEVMNALKAIELVGIASKQEFYWLLHANFVKKQEDRLIFHEAFMLYFKKRGLLEKMMETMLPQTKLPPDNAKKEAGAARIHEAFNPNKNHKEKEQEIERDAKSTFSNEEILASKDFAQMTAQELNEAFKAIKRLKMPQDMRKTRRFKPAPHGEKVDLRRTLKAAQNGLLDLLPLSFKTPRITHPPLVLMIDISGSMAAYSRLLLHFAHHLLQIRKNIHVFTFGTRLTHVTRHLKDKDIDLAMQAVSREVLDWGGGTRLASTLHTFNRHYARRVLAGGANLLLVTDGLERDNLDELELNIARLSRMSRRIVWLNPLLRYQGFEAKARGIKIILPHVDDFRSCHNLNSIAELVASLSGETR